MAAKVERKKKSMGMDISEEYISPTNLRVNLEKFDALADYDVGHKCKGTFEGTITSITKNRDFQEMTIEISKLSKEGGDDNGDTEN